MQNSRPVIQDPLGLHLPVTCMKLKYAGKCRQSNGYVICISVESCCVLVNPRDVMERWARRHSDVGAGGAARWHASSPRLHPCPTVSDNDVCMYSPMYRSQLSCIYRQFRRYNMYQGCTFLRCWGCSVCTRSTHKECGSYRSCVLWGSWYSMWSTSGASPLPRYAWLA